jgi:hypothetical protein
MKAMKMIGLAALVALMATAFVGASSAVAETTGLCGADEGAPCQAVTHIHEISVGKAKLLTSIGTTECTALFLGDVKSSGSPLVISGSFTYSSCTLGGSSCTATEENGPSEIKVLKEGHETSKVTGEGLIHLVCGSSIDCSYSGTGLVGTGKGPLLSTQANGEVTLSEQKTTKEVGGFLCPKESKLDITTTPLQATFLVAQLLYCVRYGHVTNGYYQNDTCTSERSEGNTWDLVYGEPGLRLATPICVRIWTGGLWKTRTNNICSEDLEGQNLKQGKFEKGEVAAIY